MSLTGYDIAVFEDEAAAVSELSGLSEPTLVVLVRHFACNCSADRISEVLNAVRTAGLDGALPILVVASSPSPAIAAELLAGDVSLSARAARALRLRVRLDPLRAAYAHLRCVSGVARTLCFSRQRAAFNFAGLLRFPYEMCCRGRVPGVSSVAPFQLGGVFLLSPGAAGGAPAREAYALRDQRPGWPLVDAAALRAAAEAEGVPREARTAPRRPRAARSRSASPAPPASAGKAGRRRARHE